MDYKKILANLKKKDYAPVYFLQGEESYFIDQIVDYIDKEILTEGEKSFNQVVLYGKETDFKQVVDQAMQFPMMAAYRVVIVKEAQSMSSLEKLSSYIDNPSTQTILVLAHKHKKFDKRKKAFWAALKKNAVVLETKKLYDNQVPAHIIAKSKENNLRIDNKTAFILSEHLGNDLSKIANEIEKLALNIPAGSTIDLNHIQQFVGISKDYNVFELQKAIGAKNKKKAYAIVKYFAQNSKANPIQRNIGSFYNYFSTLFLSKKFEKADDRTFASKVRVNPYFAKDYKAAASNYTLPQIKRAFKLIHAMDKASKGVETRRSNEMGIYQEFLFKLFA
ncbi:MAG: DNA polymerase III subunit delta [Saprospiraceae bacterium]|nr:DNA polymerase III subunit delta [Bacteroidia bacterium]NNE15238.1 DNA polymerase III subunit delta [Saprospiraceae bacterium]NNL92156.1 DNA polymerase III subunit delta [Saprospiraceae bacterium]